MKQFLVVEYSKRSSIDDQYPMEFSDLVSCVNLRDLEDLSMIGYGQNSFPEMSAVEGTVLPTKKRNFDDWTQTTGKPSTEGMF